MCDVPISSWVNQNSERIAENFFARRVIVNGQVNLAVHGLIKVRKKELRPLCFSLCFSRPLCFSPTLSLKRAKAKGTQLFSRPPCCHRQKELRPLCFAKLSKTCKQPEAAAFLETNDRKLNLTPYSFSHRGAQMLPRSFISTLLNPDSDISRLTLATANTKLPNSRILKNSLPSQVPVLITRGAVES